MVSKSFGCKKPNFNFNCKIQSFTTEREWLIFELIAYHSNTNNVYHHSENNSHSSFLTGIIFGIFLIDFFFYSSFTRYILMCLLWPQCLIHLIFFKAYSKDLCKLCEWTKRQQIFFNVRSTLWREHACMILNSSCQVQLREEDFEQSFSGPWNYIGVQQPKKKKPTQLGASSQRLLRRRQRLFPISAKGTRQRCFLRHS